MHVRVLGGFSVRSRGQKLVAGGPDRSGCAGNWTNNLCSLWVSREIDPNNIRVKESAQDTDLLLSAVMNVVPKSWVLSGQM